MNQLLKAAGLPLPEYQEVDGNFVIRFQKATKKITQETTQKITQEIILQLLKKSPKITREQLAGQINITPDGVKYHLDRLLKAGKIRHAGSTKKGHCKNKGVRH